MTTVRAALAAAQTRLAGADTPALDAEVLLAHTLGRQRAWLYAWPDADIAPPALERFEALVERRAGGEPIAYIVGTREFWSLAFEVTPDVLVPRPESELLVEAALESIGARGLAEPRVLDLGTGSGCVAVAIAHERPGARVVAVERDAAALGIAARNAARHGALNLDLVQGRWLAPLGRDRFDVIVANPPYVARDDPHLRSGDLRFEPVTALDGGPDGLDALRAIAAGAPRHLVPGGRVALEHGHDQAEAVAALLRDAGLVEIATRRDAAGHPRCTLAHRPS